MGDSTRGFTRRRFLTTASAVPLVNLAARAAGRQNAVPVGLELYSVRTELANDLPGTVATVAKMGYQVVEFYSPYLQWSNRLARQVRQQLDDLGIRCPSTHNPASALAGDPLQRAIELNEILGSRMIVAASPPPKLTTASDWQAFADTCTAAAEALAPLGMRAGFHNHAAEWREVDGRRPMDILAAGTPDSFVLQLDVGTAVEAKSDPVAWIEAHPGRIRSMHCKDWGAGEDRGYGVAFGEGDAPWARIFEAAERIGGIEHYYIEQEVSPAGGQFAMAERCLANYRSLRGL
jgi:sugar phosphate isomerase/epimerase